MVQAEGVILDCHSQFSIYLLLAAEAVNTLTFYKHFLLVPGEKLAIHPQSYSRFSMERRIA